MMKKFLVFVLFGLIGCTKAPLGPQEIVDLAIDFSGTEKLKNASVTFDFRNMNYEYWRKKGSFMYVRIQRDTASNQIKDVLSNDGLVRLVNGEEMDITQERRTAYSSSVNSVMYFAFLPLWLNDPAVNKFYMGTIDMEGKEYHKIKITFSEEGGGEDFEDVFYYWFDTEDYSMDYLAYSYIEEDGTGMRFRKAYNARTINGVIIQDYVNMKPKSKELLLTEIDKAYMEGALEQLSLIELKNVDILTDKK